MKNSPDDHFFQDQSLEEDFPGEEKIFPVQSLTPDLRLIPGVPSNTPTSNTHFGANQPLGGDQAKVMRDSNMRQSPATRRARAALQRKLMAGRTPSLARRDKQSQ